MSGVALEHDGGALVAERARLSGDTLSGSWYQSCFFRCPAHGRLALRRFVRRNGAA